MGSKLNKKNQKKRKFCGNQHISSETALETVSDGSGSRKRQSSPVDDVVVSPSKSGDRPTSNSQETPVTRKRIRIDTEPEFHQNCSDSNDYNFVMNFKHLTNIIELVGHCPMCLEMIRLENHLISRMGLACKLKLCCVKCEWEHYLYTSDEIGTQGPGRMHFDVNVRAAVAFREIGKGHQGLENFTRIMNMHGISFKGYEKINHKVHAAYEKVAINSMAKAAREVYANGKEKLEEDQSIVLCECSLDGTWQKRGHNSSNGVVTAISNEKCVDHHVLSKYCRGCQKWSSKQGTNEFEHWKIEHAKLLWYGYQREQR